MNTNIQSELNLCEKLLNLDLKIFSSYPKEKESNRLVKLQDDLNELKTDLDDQIRRYKKKNFEIAVVGREKAGKSSLLNAWIGFELLPSDRNRCTYTTVEIRSCAHIDDQKYLIDYLTTDQFDLNYKNIVNSHASKELQEKEYAEINSKLEQIKTYLNKPSKLKSFRNFDDVKAELRSAISDVGHARAVKNICIWTPKISSTEESNVVLYDVPGYDSPITLHKEQTKLKIAKVDAVLYAKKFIEPDLVDCEIEILKITDLNDPFLKAKDKIVVALTNCDQAVSSKDFKSLTYSNYRAWKSYDIYESRVIPVCSLAELKGNFKKLFQKFT
jgi:GTPase Era involved in 16S rRNA processing